MASSIPPPDSLPIVHADSGNSDGSAASRVVKTVKSAVRVPESETKRWRRTFDANAKSLVDGEKCVFFSFFSSCSILSIERGVVVVVVPGFWTVNNSSMLSRPRGT